MTTVMQAMFIDFLCITQRFIGEIKITLHYITLHYTSGDVVGGEWMKRIIIIIIIFLHAVT